MMLDNTGLWTKQTYLHGTNGSGIGVSVIGSEEARSYSSWAKTKHTSNSKSGGSGNGASGNGRNTQGDNGANKGRNDGGRPGGNGNNPKIGNQTPRTGNGSTNSTQPQDPAENGDPQAHRDLSHVKLRLWEQGTFSKDQRNAPRKNKE
eukprot:Pgem_evm1s1640